MRQILLGAIAGTVFGVAVATGVLLYAQTPDWYTTTPQGRLQQRLDIQELQFEQDLQHLKQSYPNPYKSPC